MLTKHDKYALTDMTKARAGFKPARSLHEVLPHAWCLTRDFVAPASCWWSFFDAGTYRPDNGAMGDLRRKSRRWLRERIPRVHRFTQKGVGIGFDLRVGRKPALSRTPLSLPLSTRTHVHPAVVCPLSPFLGNNPGEQASRPLIENDGRQDETVSQSGNGP